MLRLTVAALVLAVALSGCQSDGGDDGTSASPTPTASASPSPSPSASSSPSSSPSPSPTPSPSPSVPPSPSPSGAPPRDPVTWEVTIQGNDFVDGSLTVQKGDTVRWLHRDGTTPHTVTADNGEFDSGTPNMIQVAGLDTFEFTFDAVGNFPYHCEVHPSMTDAITVLERFDGVPA